ncbi:cytidyltransferase, partial [Verrucomicrobiaceae bacterium R5-34]|nr:cytidyltransferase [Verrucomicrobiaceae bacterium R5-34]
GEDGVDSELDLGVGWQDPAVIRETGLCVWRSGQRPVLDFKRNGDMLTGKMAILWTQGEHDTPSFADDDRDYATIERSGHLAREGVLNEDIHKLAEGIQVYHGVQLEEGMEPLPEIAGSIARKYSGGGHGGYALYLFESESARQAALEITSDLKAVEPYCV